MSPEPTPKGSQSEPEIGQDTDPDFLVTESHPGSQELLGEDQKPETDERKDTPEADREPPSISDSDTAPIGSSLPPMDDDQPEIEPLTPPPPSEPANRFERPVTPKVEPSLSKRRPIENIPDWNKVGSEEEESPKDPSAYLTDEEKQKLIESMHKPFSNTPIVPPKREKSEFTSENPPTASDQPISPPVNSTPEPVTRPAEPVDPEPDMRPRRNAFFYKNIIQLSGNPRLAERDEMTIGDRVWVLRKKKLSGRTTTIAGLSAAALLIIIFAVVMATGDGSGSGTIAGFVFDNASRPYIHGASIRIPELGKTYQSDGQGFFVTEDLPAGSYRIEYVVDGQIIGIDYATIAEGEITPLALKPSDEKELAEELAAVESESSSALASVGDDSKSARNSIDTRQTSVEKKRTPEAEVPRPVEIESPRMAQVPTESRIVPVESPGSPAAEMPGPVETERPRIAQTASTGESAQPASTEVRTESNSTRKPQSQPAYAKLRLEANVDNARIRLGDRTLGAGNLTYSDVPAGRHQYTVSADGYETLSGYIRLEAGKVSVVKANLTALPTAQKQQTYDAADYYYSGVTAHNEGDFNSAIADLSEAIRRDPSYVDAYAARGDAYRSRQFADDAHDDYLRAAEILQLKKEYQGAVGMFTKAIEVKPSSVAAHLGRGNLYLTRGEELSAIADFEAVVRADRGNFAGYLGLGKARFARGDYERAVNHFQDARSLDSDNPQVYQYLMLAYMADNDLGNVQKSFERFTRVADKEEIDRIKTDPKYTAVMRIVERNDL